MTLDIQDIWEGHPKEGRHTLFTGHPRTSLAPGIHCTPLATPGA